jgi:hypothetical protein
MFSLLFCTLSIVFGNVKDKVNDFQSVSFVSYEEKEGATELSNV